MILPENGKILIIDDNINEALPLMKLLSVKGIPYMYFSGKDDGLPTSLCGIRVVFLDLRLNNAISGEKNIISSVLQVLGKLISPQNGPYILLVWSKHDSEFTDKLREAIDKTSFSPEFIMSLSKNDYFETETGLSEQFKESATKILSEFLGNDIKNENVIEKLDLLLQEMDCFNKKGSKVDALTLIEDKLKTELEKANLFSFFVLWENAINSAKIRTVNEIYNQMPRNIPKEKILAAMLYYMAYYQLEKSIEAPQTDEQIKFAAAVATLNEMFGYFYQEATQTLSKSGVPQLYIKEDESFKKDSNAEKYNTWIMTSPPASIIRPGNVYEDTDKRFEPHGLLYGKNEQSLDNNLQIFLKQEGLIHVFVEISADCDIAQDKQYVSKIVYGILIPQDKYKKLCENKTVRNKKTNGYQPPEYIKDFGEIEITNSDGAKSNQIMHLIFNLNLATYCSKDYIAGSKAIISLRKSFVVNLQSDLGKNLSRQGVALFY